MSQNNHKKESAFLERVRGTLDDSVDNLDTGTLSRLSQARHVALEAAKSRPEQRGHSFWFSLAGLAAATAVVFLAVFLAREPSGPQYYSGLEDVEILAASENPEFFVNLEFYGWLAEEMDDAG